MKKTTYYVTASDPFNRHAYDPFYQEEFDDLEEAEDTAEDLPEKWASDLCPSDRGAGIYWRVAQVIVDRIDKDEDCNGEYENTRTISWRVICFVEFDTTLWDDPERSGYEGEELEEERKEYAEYVEAETFEAENRYDRVIVKDSALWDEIKKTYLKD